jgi:beta-glucosidase
VVSNWGGSQSGPAIADVLFGDYNPDGLLPYTYPRYSGEILSYDHKLTNEKVEPTAIDYVPQYTFGHGLSYTQFDYSDFSLSSDQLSADGKLKVKVTVKNTGKMAGKHTVELYSRDLFASIVPSVKRLRKFQKISLAPGASQTLEFVLDKSDLAFVNEQLKTVTEAGDFDLMVGPLTKTFHYSQQ